LFLTYKVPINEKIIHNSNPLTPRLKLFSMAQEIIDKKQPKESL
jgi:hypothetical protein